MKIAHLEFGRHVYGGAEQVLLLMQGLRDRGVDNTLICPEDADIGARARALDLPIRTLRFAGEHDLRAMIRIRRHLCDLVPDVIHLHSRRGADTLGAIAARRCARPVVLSRRVDNPELRSVAWLKYRLYDRVIVISQAIGEVLREAGVPERKIRCVPSVISTDRFAPAAGRAEFEQRFAIPPGSRVIGMAAQFIERKGHRYLLASIPTVLASHPNTVFILFGRGPLWQRIQADLRAGPYQHAVRLPGFVADLPRWLPCLDVLVHPALREGLGVILLQAAALGVPIVATSVGGIPEVVAHEENGLLVPPADIAALTAALMRLLSHRDLAMALGRGGIARIQRSFTPAAMVAGHLAVYRELIDT